MTTASGRCSYHVPSNPYVSKSSSEVSTCDSPAISRSSSRTFGLTSVCTLCGLGQGAIELDRSARTFGKQRVRKIGECRPQIAFVQNGRERQRCAAIGNFGVRNDRPNRRDDLLR